MGTLLNHLHPRDSSGTTYSEDDNVHPNVPGSGYGEEACSLWVALLPAHPSYRGDLCERVKELGWQSGRLWRSGEEEVFTWIGKAPRGQCTFDLTGSKFPAACFNLTSHSSPSPTPPSNSMSPAGEPLLSSDAVSGMLCYRGSTNTARHHPQYPPI